jgi:hypothetical protein
LKSTGLERPASRVKFQTAGSISSPSPISAGFAAATRQTGSGLPGLLQLRTSTALSFNPPSRHLMELSCSAFQLMRVSFTSSTGLLTRIKSLSVRLTEQPLFGRFKTKISRPLRSPFFQRRVIFILFASFPKIRIWYFWRDRMASFTCFPSFKIIRSLFKSSALAKRSSTRFALI